MLKHFVIAMLQSSGHRSTLGISGTFQNRLGKILRNNKAIWQDFTSSSLRLVPRLVLGGYEPPKLDDLLKVQLHAIITSTCPKTRAWGAVNRHNIPKGLGALQKGSMTSRKALKGPGRPPEGLPSLWRAHLKAPPF
jgi:hypothetical protein